MSPFLQIFDIRGMNPLCPPCQVDEPPKSPLSGGLTFFAPLTRGVGGFYNLHQIPIHSLNVIQHVSISISQDSQSILTQHLCSCFVIFSVLCVRITIYLNHQSELRAVEVNYITTERFLSGELVSFKLLSTQNLVPDSLFGRAGIIPVLPS